MGIVYVITCSETGEQYIGATRGPLGRRWTLHKDHLRKRTAASRLQAAYDRWGLASLECEALAEVDDKILRRVEKKVINQLKPALNYQDLHANQVTAWARRKRGVPVKDLDLPAYDPSIRRRRTYDIAGEQLTMEQIEAKYPKHVVTRVQAGEVGPRVLRPRYVHV